MGFLILAPYSWLLTPLYYLLTPSSYNKNYVKRSITYVSGYRHFHGRSGIRLRLCGLHLH